MKCIIETLRCWTQRTRRRLGFVRAAHASSEENAVYSLMGWPDLPARFHRASVLRVMSIMTVRPVTRRWMVWRSGLSADQVCSLLQELQQQRMLKTRR